MPKKVPVMFLSGSFAVTLQCSHQCDHSVPGSEILKEPKQCPKDVLKQYICSVLGVFLQCTTFGKIWGNSGNTASTFQMFQVLQFSWHVLAVSGIDFRNLFLSVIFPTFTLLPSVFICIEHSHDSHNLQTWPGHRVLYPETVCGQQVDVIREHEAVPLLAYAGTLELPLHGPPLPPVYTMTPATDN